MSTLQTCTMCNGKLNYSETHYCTRSLSERIVKLTSTISKLTDLVKQKANIDDVVSKENITTILKDLSKEHITDAIRQQA